MRKDDLTYDQKLAELRLDVTHPQSKGKIFVLLEGTSDVRLFRKLYNHENCKVEPIPGGKSKLEECLADLSKVINLTIGVRDADFLHLEGKSPARENLFLTDYHDLEMMTIASDDTFSAIVYEFGRENKSEHNDLRASLLEGLSFIGYFRWYNESNNLELSFKGLGLGDLFDCTNRTIDKHACVQKVLKQSPNAKVRDEKLVVEEVDKLYDKTNDLFQVCSGHDLMKVMAIYFSKRGISEKGVNHERISSQMRTAYGIGEFRKTRLYSNGNNWAKKMDCSLHAEA